MITIAIDFGTSNTVVYDSRAGIVFQEPTVLACHKNQKNQVYSIGYEAAKLLGRAPDDMVLYEPVTHSLVNDVNIAILFLNTVFQQNKIRFVHRAQMIFTAPSDISMVQRNALFEIGKHFKCKKVIIESKSKMAAIGSDVDASSSSGSMIVDLGAGTTDVSVISIGKIVVQKVIPIAGKTIDEDIVRHMFLKHHLRIGMKNAEYIKMRIGTVASEKENRCLQVRGINTETSLPHSVVITTYEISDVLKRSVDHIVDCVRDTLFATPAELAGDIIENGISLTGGLSLLGGIREYMEKELNIPVRITSDPLLSSIEGCRIFAREK